MNLILCPAAGLAGSIDNFGNGLAIRVGLVAGHETMNWAVKNIVAQSPLRNIIAVYSQARE